MQLYNDTFMFENTIKLYTERVDVDPLGLRTWRLEADHEGNMLHSLTSCEFALKWNISNLFVNSDETSEIVKYPYFTALTKNTEFSSHFT